MFPNPVPFSNVFSDSSGVLEGEGLVRSCSIQGKLWCCEQPAVYHDTESLSRLNHRCLRRIASTTLGDSLTERTFEDWTVLSRPASHIMNIHIYGPRRSLRSLVCFMCLVTVTTHADSCIGFSTSIASDIRAARISRVLHDYKYARG
jgi:hypothetical protein